MSLARVYIAAILLIFRTLCNTETTENKKIKVNDFDSIKHSSVDDIPNDAKNMEQEKNNTDQIMPLLPPIILLDFDNSTTNDNATIDEKLKRTVNNNLGYGFNQNVLHAPRKYNYYFPTGKTGTTVTIEESISPILPRTIIEKVLSSKQKVVSDSYEDFRSQPESYETRDSTKSNFQNPTSSQYNSPMISQSLFGLRTKLTKTFDSEQYRGFSSSTRSLIGNPYSNVNYQNGAYAATTLQSLMLNSAETEVDYITPSPQSYTASSSSQYVYVTPSPPSYTEVNSQRYLNSQHAINMQGYSAVQTSIESSTTNPINTIALLENIGVQSKKNSHDYVRPTTNTVESSTSASDDVPSYAENVGSFTNLPRYTIENGFRYENKIFWKYPDGRVSDMPPMTYETYSKYPSLAALQAARSQEIASQIDESVSTKNSVLSQGPVQFPISPKSNGLPTPFISAESLSKLPQQQIYRLGYQNLVNQKQIIPQQPKVGVFSTYSTTFSPLKNSVKTNEKNQKNQYETSRRSMSKYMVNSPNPEYINSFTTESVSRSTTPRAFISSTRKNSVKKTNTSSKNLENYANLQYKDLLNYNPSISQYIKNPASILNVRPTFVQAGNSLIPVIILRVDGVPPIQSDVMPNVNLKALLQQYLLQYVRSIEELAQPTNYDFENTQFSKEQHPFSTSPLRQLTQFIQNSNAQDLVGNPTESYVGRSSYEASNLDAEKSLSNVKYGERIAIRPKVKSVQIVEDARFEK